MNGGRKENKILRAFIRVHWSRMTDQMIAKEFDCSSIKVSAMRRAMGFVRGGEHLKKMREAHKTGKIYIGRGPDKVARKLSDKQIANRRMKGL